MKTRILSFLLIPTMVAMADTSRGAVTNLFANPDGWKTWVQRPEITPGDEYPVFDTDIGRVGYMICFDNHQPEVSRALAIHGAEIIVFSNDSDGRERGTLYEAYMQTRALDNQVHIVASVNKAGQTLIVTPRGEIVACAAKEPGSLAVVTCDLSAGVRDGSGREIEERYMRVRRADTFAPLLREYSERRPDANISVSR